MVDDPASDHGFTIHSLDGIADVLIGSKEGPGSGYPALLDIDVNHSGAPFVGTAAAIAGSVWIGDPGNAFSRLRINSNGNADRTMTIQQVVGDTGVADFKNAGGFDIVRILDPVTISVTE